MPVLNSRNIVAIATKILNGIFMERVYLIALYIHIPSSCFSDSGGGGGGGVLGTRLVYV